MGNKHQQTKALCKGFTLVEVMITVAILAFGIVTIYEAFFVSIDTYGYYTNYLSTQDWFSQKIWQMQEELMEYKALVVEQTSGQIVRNHKTFDWVMNVTQLDIEQGLYQVKLTLSWREGNKRVDTVREVYLLPVELKIYEEGAA